MPPKNKKELAVIEEKLAELTAQKNQINTDIMTLTNAREILMR